MRSVPMLYNEQQLPLVREGAPHGQGSNFQTRRNIWSWAPAAARHQHGQTDWPSVAMWLWLWLLSRRESWDDSEKSRKLVWDGRQPGASEWSEVSGLVSELEDWFGSAVVSCCCEKLVAEAREQFGNPDEGERPPLEAVTRQDWCRTVEWEDLVRAVVNWRVSELAIAL
jgi:hypothetical protein